MIGEIGLYVTKICCFVGQLSYDIGHWLKMSRSFKLNMQRWIVHKKIN